VSELTREDIEAIDEAVEAGRTSARRSRAGLRRQAPAGEIGRYVADVSARARPPGAPDDAELARRAQAGDVAARERLIEEALPTIVSLARAYRAEGLELADLVQEGCVGLLRALARYRPEEGTPFSAYALWWIRQGLQELRSDFMRPLRLPPRALRQLAQLKSEHGRVYAAEHREPPLAELADRLGIDRAQADALLRADAGFRSLAEPLGGDDGEVGLLGDLLEDPLSAAAFEDVLEAIAGEQLRALLGHLTDREREIVDARFGLDERPPERLADIGERLGVSVERVRQLEERALAKLRHAG
jgi:RNA polymerase primary sigma factor